LGRAPESANVIASFEGMPIWKVVEAILGSEEFRRRKLSELENYYFRFSPISNVDMGDNLAVSEIINRVGAVWERYGREEPHWSVMTNSLFKRERLDAKMTEEFFATGKADVELFIRNCARIGKSPEGTVLDFGCGVGRLGEHLSRIFQKYIGVDISSSHLGLAKERLSGRRNVELQLLPEFLKKDVRFDAMYSVIVLQHNPPPVMYALLKELLMRLNPGGVASFQIPCFAFDYRFSASQYLKQPQAWEMEMHALPQPILFELFETTRCRVHEVVPDGRAGTAGISYSFLLTKC
jgi:SAM-dependent methyltransferase